MAMSRVGINFPADISEGIKEEMKRLFKKVTVADIDRLTIEEISLVHEQIKGGHNEVCAVDSEVYDRLTKHPRRKSAIMILAAANIAD